MDATQSRVTIDDVAERAGVSIATVSRVVNGRYGVAPTTLNRVRAAVVDLGYESSLVARSLRSQRTNVIGILVADIEPFSAELLKGIGQGAPRLRLRAHRLRRRTPATRTAGNAATCRGSAARSPTARSSSRPRSSRSCRTSRSSPSTPTSVARSSRRSTPRTSKARRGDRPPHRARAPPDRLPRRPARSRIGAPARSRATGALEACRHRLRPRSRARRRVHGGDRRGAGPRVAGDRAIVRPPSSPPTTSRRSRRCAPRPSLGISDPPRPFGRRIRQHPRVGAHRPAADHRRSIDPGTRPRSGAHPRRADRASRTPPISAATRSTSRCRRARRSADRARLRGAETRPATTASRPRLESFTTHKGEPTLTTKHHHRRWRAISLVTVLALAGTACGDDDDAADDGAASDATGDTTAGTTGSDATGRRRRCRRRRARHDQLVAHPEQRSRPANWQAMADEFTALAPERHDRHQRPRERSVQGRRCRPTSKLATFPTCSSRGAAAVCASRSRPARAGHHRAVVGVHRHPQPGRRRSLQRRRQAVRHPVQPRHGRVLVQQGPLRPRPASTRRPTTWDELLDVVQQLKDAGITPIAVGAGDKWPAHFYYSYLMVRLGGADVMNEIAADGNFNVPEVIDRRRELKRLIDLEPFQPGFLAAAVGRRRRRSRHDGHRPGGDGPHGPMGTWARSAARPASPRASSSPSNSVGSRSRWSTAAPEPRPTRFGGGDGFAVGKDAPPEAVEFLEFITNVDNAKVWGESGSGLAGDQGVGGVDHRSEHADGPAGLDQAGFVQLFLDQFFTPDVGAAVNDAVQTLCSPAPPPPKRSPARSRPQPPADCTGPPVRVGGSAPTRTARDSCRPIRAAHFHDDSYSPVRRYGDA